MTDAKEPALLLLSPEARRALERAQARWLSYGVRLYACPGYAPRLLVVLGEAHLKLRAASELGREIVGHFSLRGVETFQRRSVASGALLGFLIQAPRSLFCLLSLGAVKGSTITDAKHAPGGHAVELERTDHVPLGLHVGALYLSALFSVLFALVGVTAADLAGVAPAWTALASAWLTPIAGLFDLHLLALVPAIALRDRAWSWLVHPLLAIVTLRDRLMAEGTLRMLSDFPEAPTALVIMGRAHLPGFERELVQKLGFRRLDAAMDLPSKRP